MGPDEKDSIYTSIAILVLLAFLLTVFTVMDGAPTTWPTPQRPWRDMFHR